MMKKILLAVIMTVGINSYASAQATFTAKDASGTTQTFKSFNCTSNICSLSVPSDVTGAAFGVTGNPFYVAPASGATFPMSASALPLPAGAATQTTLAAILSALGSPLQAGGTVTQGNAGSNAQAWWTQIGDTSRGPAKVQAGNGAGTTDVALTVADPNVLAAINAAIPAGTNIIGKVGIDQTTPGTTNGVQVNAALPAGTNVIGFASNDPCAQATKLGAPISLTASGQVIAGTASKKTYICSIDLVSATAQNIALVEGTGVSVVLLPPSLGTWDRPVSRSL